MSRSAGSRISYCKKSLRRVRGEFFSISAEETLAFGDRFNDVEMLEYAGLSYVVENAEEGLAEHADCVTPTVEAVVRKLVDQ